MRYLKSQKGIALVTALMLTLISLVIIMAVLYMVTQGTKVSAAQKRYHNVLEASYGGLDLYLKDFIPRAIGPSFNGTLNASFSSILSAYPSGLAMSSPAGAACLQQKMILPSASWSVCSAASNSADPKATPDLQFTLSGLAGQPGYTVYNKIVDTRDGNTSLASNELAVTGGVVYNAELGGTTGGGQHFPYLYTIEVLAEGASSAKEKVALSVLYAY